jgi:hypothetical protein
MNVRTYSGSVWRVIDGVSPIVEGAIHGGKFERIGIGTGLDGYARWALKHFPIVLGT